MNMERTVAVYSVKTEDERMEAELRARPTTRRDIKETWDYLNALPRRRPNKVNQRRPMRSTDDLVHTLLHMTSL